MKANPEKVAEYMRNTRKRFPERERARVILNRAIRRGEIVRPTVCEDCGRYEGWNNEPLPGKGVIEGHHTDYTQPLIVEWLCRLCHNEMRLV